MVYVVIIMLKINSSKKCQESNEKMFKWLREKLIEIYIIVVDINLIFVELERIIVIICNGVNVVWL
jgi:hypothetical protein